MSAVENREKGGVSRLFVGLVVGPAGLATALWFGHVYLATYAGLIWQENVSYLAIAISATLVLPLLVPLLIQAESSFLALLGSILLFSGVAGLFIAYGFWGVKGRANLLQRALTRGESLVCRNQTVSSEEELKGIFLKHERTLFARKC